MDRAAGEAKLAEGASRRIAAHIAGLRYEALSPGTLRGFRRAVLDFTTCAIAGSAMPVSRALLSYYEAHDATRAATVLGSSARLSAPNAALVNGANAHGLDFDDGHTHGSAHPAGAIFPAVFAAAEQDNADSRSIALAAVIGYDVMLRIAAAMHPASARRGFHNTAIAGVFGAAAAVSALFELAPEQANHALGLAGSFSAGTREYLDEGAEVKRIHPGKAARDGLLCAEFARRGVTGPSKILEGRYGFFRTHAGDQVNWGRLFEGLGERFEIENVYFKPYPCCRHYHSIIDGICDLRGAHRISADEVARIDLGLYAVGVNGHDHKHCDTLLDAQMSAPCAAALAMVDGKVSAAQFLPQSLERPEMKALLPRIATHVDAECERIYPQVRSGAVRLTLRDGRTLESRVVHPKGEAANPMSDADLEAKFRVNCEPLVGAAACDALLERIAHFETAEGVHQLVSLVPAVPPAVSIG